MFAASSVIDTLARIQLSHLKLNWPMNCGLFLKMGISRPLFLYFHLFNTVFNKQMFHKNVPMTEFEPWISGVKGDRSTN